MSNALKTAASTLAKGEDSVLVVPANDVSTTAAVLREHAGEIAAVPVDPVPPRTGTQPLDPEELEALGPAENRFTTNCRHKFHAACMGAAAAHASLGICHPS